MMFRKLLARLTGDMLVSVQYGYSQCVRKVRWDGNGRPYITVYGEVTRLDVKHPERPWFPLNFETKTVDGIEVPE